jgi:3-phenylpropionate/cinnamic acid dioxygenase small subunit
MSSAAAEQVDNAHELDKTVIEIDSMIIHGNERKLMRRIYRLEILSRDIVGGETYDWLRHRISICQIQRCVTEAQARQCLCRFGSVRHR